MKTVHKIIWTAATIWGLVVVLQLCQPAHAEPGDSAALTAAKDKPDPKLTPGVLCTEKDQNFSVLRYAEKIPYCNRNVSEDEKLKIAKEYGNIPKAKWKLYEFDHLIPLCAGGSDDIGNLWPQPISEAKEKDKVEDFVCAQMKAGKMTQAQAVQKIRDWFTSP